MRMVGQNPTEKELTNLINKYDSGNSKIALNDFYMLIYDRMQGTDIYLNTREVVYFFLNIHIFKIF